MTTLSTNQLPGVPGPTAMHVASGWLDAEIDTTSSASTRALLLHESALINEGSGNPTEAARLHLQAVNSDPQLSEPVERLLMIFEQRHSLKNLGRVVERLYQLANTVEDRERASWERAAFALIEQRDVNTARQVLLDIVESVPNGIVAWVLLNIVAEQAQDFELLERTLRTRAALTDNSSWSGLLLLELAETQNELGQFEAALETLDQVISANGPMTFGALDSLERLSSSQRQYDVLSRVLVSKASILERATHDVSIGESLGVPRWRRATSHVADAFLRAAIARRADGNTTEAATLIERAMGLLPHDPIVQHVALLCAEERNDFDLVVSLAKSIASRSQGDGSGSVWLRAAFCELTRHDSDAALAAIATARRVAPHSTALRATELHISSTRGNAANYVTSIEACAEILHNDVAKSRYFVAASELWIRRLRDTNSARAALAQAELFGLEPRVSNRTARLLAASLNDEDWYDESTRRLATTAADPDEQAELWIELARLRIAKSQPERANRAMEALAALHLSPWIAVAFQAYNFAAATEAPLLPQSVSADSLAVEMPLAEPGIEQPLLKLAEQVADPAFQRAYAVANVIRTLRAGRRSDAVQQLKSMAEKDPTDSLVVFTLSDMLLADGDQGAAAAILNSAAALISDPTLPGIAALKAALLNAQSGNREQCRVALDCARLRAPDATAIAEPWLLRKVFPNDQDVRRQVLEGLLDDKPRERLLLERFTLELGTQNLATAGLILEGLPLSGTPIGLAIEFAKILIDTGTNGDALDALTSRVPGFRGVAAALKIHDAFAACQNQTAEYLDAVKTWVKDDDSIIAALEYLCTARLLCNVELELDAWSVLSQRLDHSHQFAASIAFARVQLFDSNSRPPLLASREAQARILNCEHSRPGCDPRRRSHALAELAPLLGESDRKLAKILGTFSILASGNAMQALDGFRSIVDEDSQNTTGWEGLRLAAQACSDQRSVAEASEALGGLYHDSGLAAELYEQAAAHWFELDEATRAEGALRHAVARDIRRFSAFDRLFRRVRDRNDGPSLLELIDARLDVSDEVDELVKLHWERARVLRSLGDREAALQALENVTLLEPDHVGALALAAEISIATNRLPDAAKFLERLARLESAPSKQRVMSGLAAADLYDGKLKLPELAVSVLLALDGAGLGNLAIRERLARAAARSENWDLAAEMLSHLAEYRESSAGRVEAARLAVSILRDRLATPALGLSAIQRILAEVPDDPEAIDFVLEQHFSSEVTQELCAQIRDTLLAKLLDIPMDESSIGQLAQIAAILDDVALRQITLGALATVGAVGTDIIEELERIAMRVAHLPSMSLDENGFRDLAEVGDDGPLSDLFANLAPHFAEMLGPSLAMLGVSKKQRIDPRSGMPLRNEIASWAGALGVRDFELYVASIEPDAVVGIPGETPSLIVGSGVRAPLAPAHRQLVARELYAIRRGTSILEHRSPTEIAALVVAACRIAEVPISAPPYALVDEFTRLLNSLPRKAKKLLPALCSSISAVAADPLEWHAAAISSMDRMTALAGGDVSSVIASNNSQNQRGLIGSSPMRTERLLRFVFSNQFLALRERLGIGVK